MSTVLRVHNQDAAPQLVVPSRAVVEQMGEYFLFVAKDTVLHGAPENSAAAGNGGKGAAAAPGGEKDTPAKSGADTVETPKLRAFQVKVQPGQTVGANVIIKSGIREGDRVVVDGVQALHDGGQINASSKTAGDGKGGPGGKEQTDSSKNK
jgi:membrane fusion protein (multidrug efflux system)